MRYPAGKKQRNRGSAEVGRRLVETMNMDQVAGMVEGHDYHNEAPDNIHGMQSLHIPEYT